jgi:hypothetical protein
LIYGSNGAPTLRVPSSAKLKESSHGCNPRHTSSHPRAGHLLLLRQTNRGRQYRPVRPASSRWRVHRLHSMAAQPQPAHCPQDPSAVLVAPDSPPLPPGLTTGPRLQFGWQFTRVRRRPGETGQRRWSSLNESGQPRPELLMRLGSCPLPTLVRCGPCAFFGLCLCQSLPRSCRELLCLIRAAADAFHLVDLVADVGRRAVGLVVVEQVA